MSKKTASLAIALALASSSLVACSNSSSELPKPKSTATSVRPAVSGERFTEIQKNIFDSIKKADESLKPEDLKARTTGPFTKMRTAQYQLKGILADSYNVKALSSTATSTVSTGSDSYPHYALSVMNPVQGSNLPTVDVFTQSQARSNWQLWGSLDVMPGASLPKLDSGDKGMEVIKLDSSDGLVASPKQVVDAYVTLNNTHTDSQGLTFADDRLRPQLKNAHESNAKTVDGVGQAFMSFAAPEDQIVALRTSNGGALVFSAFDYNTEIRVTAAGGSIKIGGEGGSLATGTAGEQVEVSGTLVQNFSGVVGLYIPPAGSDDQSISLVAASMPQLVSVSNG
ncbi:MAG: hypothetical protein Q3979_02000 [Actinomycetaceae bacterium]|nr:hypothetical protein [Actinomycetaceae bacterium]